ncbi:EAL domain-containing protein [Marinobacter sp.]|uniref:sensor domain-containing phosphodiesterase n=1 Tax=Marinobacter sp. TaxID=50741 RepID=UPI00384C39D1
MHSSLYEKYRISMLRHMEILDTPRESRFDRITRVAQEVYRTEIALLSLVDSDRQWFKSSRGLDVQETPREVSFCSHAILQDDVFIVEDASRDPRFSGNSLVTGQPHIRFYAGVPIREPHGFKIGTLCVIDSSARKVTDGQMEALRGLAAMAETELERGFDQPPGDSVVTPSAIARALRHCQIRLSTDAGEEGSFDPVLRELMALTGSDFGMIGELASVNTHSQLEIASVAGFESLADHPVFRNCPLGETLTDGQLDSVLDLAGLGHPAGPVPADLEQPDTPSFIGFPVVIRGHLEGLVMLARRSEKYPRSLHSELASLIQIVATLIERRRLEREKQSIQTAVTRKDGRDEVTNLPNRRRLNTLLEAELRLCERRGGSVSTCFIDLDQFKAINDAHGSATGDEVLRTIARRLEAEVGEKGVVAGPGGDEFVVLQRDVGSDSSYQRLLNAIARPIHTKAGVIEMSGSMGIAIYPNDSSDADTLLRHAEQTMYQAKEEGGNDFRVFDVNSHQHRTERLQILDEARRGLPAGEFELFYQPKVNLADNSIKGFEALIRWNHPARGLLAPDQFLPQIELSDLDVTLGRFVIGQAMKTLMVFDRQRLDYTLSVNLSPSHFLSECFLDELRTTLAAYPARVGRRLTLEILETTALDDSAAAVEAVKACQQAGVSVSLDDFGTGFSSLSYFRKLPLDEIKIDKSFIMDMMKDRDDAMIVQSIISLSRQFGRRVVAEGIETQELADELRRLGCDIGQGYLYSRPVSLSNALTWARDFEGCDDAKVGFFSCANG